MINNITVKLKKTTTIKQKNLFNDTHSLNMKAFAPAKSWVYNMCR